MRDIIPQQILDEFNNGNGEAFATLYNSLHDTVYSFAKKFTVSAEDAQDIVADTFYKLWTLRGSFKTPGKLKSFLFTTVKNACLDYLKHKKIVATHHHNILRALLSQKEEDTEPDWITMVLLQTIREEIEKLPGQRRLIFKLAYLEGLKNQEIASMLKITEKTVRNQKTKALQRLRIFRRSI